MMQTPPLYPTKRSRVLSETSEIEICENNDEVIPSGTLKLEKCKQRWRY